MIIQLRYQFELRYFYILCTSINCSDSFWFCNFFLCPFVTTAVVNSVLSRCSRFIIYISCPKPRINFWTLKRSEEKFLLNSFWKWEENSEHLVSQPLIEVGHFFLLQTSDQPWTPSKWNGKPTRGYPNSSSLGITNTSFLDGLGRRRLGRGILILLLPSIRNPSSGLITCYKDHRI